MRKVCFFLFVVAFLGCLSWKEPPVPESTQVDWPVGPFVLTERSGRAVSRDDLLGKIWVASFIFTRCSGPCPQVSANMARLQAELAGDQNVVLVTFTVDPKYDTPEVLRKYAERFGADPKRWLFLTGDQDEIYGLCKNSFRSAAEQNRGTARVPGQEVAHTTRLFVVDRHGRIRGFYDGSQIDAAGQPVDDIPNLLKKIAELERVPS